MEISRLYLATEPPITKSCTLSLCTMLLSTIRLFEHDPRDRRGLDEARPNSKIACSVSRVLKNLSTSNVEGSSGSKISKDVGAYTTPVVLGKRNSTPAIINVDVKSTVKPRRLCRLASQVRKRPSPSQHAKEARPQRPRPVSSETEMEGKTVQEQQSKKGPRANASYYSEN